MLPPSYIESLAPAERKILWNIHIEQRKREEKPDQNVNTYDILSPNLPPMTGTGETK